MPHNTSITIARVAQFWTEEVKPPLHQALELAPDDKLDWAPARDMITLGNIFMHIAEASDWSTLTGNGWKSFSHPRRRCSNRNTI
jgi:hypothetical protein